MSEEFEVRGSHEDLMDEAAERDPKGMAGQLAVMTAILATVGAMFSIDPATAIGMVASAIPAARRNSGT